MNRIVRSKLEMAVRVRDFSRAHPSADASYASIVGQLEALIVRMQALARQQQAGFLARSSASARRLTLRWRIHDRLLRHLVTVAEVAARERPALTKRFRLPDGRDSHEAFVTLARELLEQGRSEYELLVRHGLAERLLDDLASALDAFDASVTAFNEARREHVGARAELDAVSREVMTLVTLLDGLNRYRFPEGGELRAAWESARKLGSYRRAREEGAGEVTVRGVGSEQ